MYHMVSCLILYVRSLPLALLANSLVILFWLYLLMHGYYSMPILLVRRLHISYSALLLSIH